MTKRGRGRQPGFKMTEAHRDKIRQSNILSYLVRHVEGEREMSATQVQAGLGLLKKVMPDMQFSEIQADVNVEYPDSIELVTPGDGVEGKD